jgi:GDP-4-dehydro-6-deoxy-D-mannose reductase
MTNSILITGSSGFIGTHLSRHLSAQGYQVHTLSHAVEDFSATRALIRSLKPDWVIHLAGISHVGKCTENPSLAYQVNLSGTMSLVEAVIQEMPSATLLFASTAHIYSGVSTKTDVTLKNKSWSERQDIQPQNVYARTKLSAETVLREMTQYYGLRSVIFRLFNHTHQSQSPEFFLPHLYRQIQSGQTRIPVGNLDLWRDLGSIQDLLGAFELTLRRLIVIPGKAEVYNVCSGRAKRLGDLAELLADGLGKSVVFESSVERLRANESSWIEGDHSKLSAAIGWIPSAKTSAQLIQHFLSPL